MNEFYKHPWFDASPPERGIHSAEYGFFASELLLSHSTQITGLPEPAVFGQAEVKRLLKEIRAMPVRRIEQTRAVNREHKLNPRRRIKEPPEEKGFDWRDPEAWE